MVVLGIDTSTINLNLSILVKEDEVERIFSLNKEVKNHAQYLPSLIDELLKRANCDLKSLSAISVINGPGSFTGLRVGISTALGLVCGLKIPLFSFSSLFIIASYEKKSGKGLAILDARKGEFYAQSFFRENGEIMPLCEPTTLKYDKVKEVSFDCDWGVGLLIQDSLAQFLPKKFTLLQKANLSELITKKTLKKVFIGEKGEREVSPLYVREPDVFIQN